MKSSKLMEHWNETYGEALTDELYGVALNIKDAARIEALADMFPSITKEQIVRDLITAALEDLTSSFPYVAGDKVVARDEDGHPVYEDVGPTPQFLELSRKHLQEATSDKH